MLRRTYDRARFLPCLLLPPLGLALYRAPGRDDAYITYWAADVLARTGEIVNYNGERLEQSSSLLHVLILAALAKVTPLSVPAAGWLVGVIAGIVVVALAVVIADRLEPGAGWRAGVFVATAGYVVYWSFGGLETSLATATLLLALWGLDRLVRGEGHVVTASALYLGPYLLSRPESPLILGAVSAGMLLCALAARRWPMFESFSEVRCAVRALVAVVGVSVVIAAGRLLYFGAIAPQPAQAKVGLRIVDGLRYVGSALTNVGALALLAVAVVAVMRRRNQPMEALLWLAAAAQVGFVVAGGGDWMEAGRFLVPLLAIAAILAAIGISRTSWCRVLTVGLVAVQLFGLLEVARVESTGQPVFASLKGIPPGVPDGLPWYETANRVHLRDRTFEPKLEAVVERLHRALNRRVVVSSGQAGSVLYYLMEHHADDVTFIDRYQLTTDWFGRCRDGLDLSRSGSQMRYAYWFSHIDECGVQSPDVVFEIGVVRREGLGPGYVAIEEPAQTVMTASGVLKGEPILVAQWIAVRVELADIARG